MTRSPKRVKVNTASYTAHPIVVLAVDTASVSGWAIRVRGKLVASGQIDTTRRGAAGVVLGRAIAHADAQQLKLWIVLERAWGGTTNTLIGLGMARERWMSEIRCARLVSLGRVVSVMPSQWRSGLFGSRWVRAPRDEVRAYELQYASGETKRGDIGDDEAAAICISAWAARAARLKG